MVRVESGLHRAALGMMKLSFAKRGADSLDSEPLHLLCLGAHSDDIEIGCGATLLELQRAGQKLNITWVVLSAIGKRGDEARMGTERFASHADVRPELKEFKDGFLPYHGIEVKQFFEDLKSRVNPDVIFSHWGGDGHQDHRLVSELVWNTFRNHLILEYEIPKYDGDMGRPNVFMPIDESIARQKVAGLDAAFESQRSKAWFKPETFLGLMRLRGMESNSPSGYAEAFYARKLVLSSEIG